MVGEGVGQGGLRSEVEIGGELGLRSEEEDEQRQSSGLQVFIEYTEGDNTEPLVEAIRSVTAKSVRDTSDCLEVSLAEVPLTHSCQGHL